MRQEALGIMADSRIALEEDREAKLKIAISARDAVGTGGGTVAIETARCMTRLGHDVTLVTDYDVTGLVDGCVALTMPIGNALRSWDPTSKILSRFRHLLRLVLFSIYGQVQLTRLRKNGHITIDHNIEAFGGDIVVMHNIFTEQSKSDQRPWLQRVPQYLNPAFSFRIARERIVLRSSGVSAAVCISEETLTQTAKYSRAGIELVCIPNGIDLDRYKPVGDDVRKALRFDLAAPDGSFILLFVAHEFESKRLDLVIAALEHCDSRAILWVVGGRFSDAKPYADLAERIGVAGRVEFFGTRMDVDLFMKTADCFVFPSNYETWGMVVLEALACGLPVIMTEVGCASLVINEPHNGFITDQNAIAIARHVDFLLKQPQRMETVRSNCRATAEKFSWPSISEKYISLIRAISKRKAADGE